MGAQHSSPKHAPGAAGGGVSYDSLALTDDDGRDPRGGGANGGAEAFEMLDSPRAGNGHAVGGPEAGGSASSSSSEEGGDDADIDDEDDELVVYHSAHDEDSARLLPGAVVVDNGVGGGSRKRRGKAVVAKPADPENEESFISVTLQIFFPFLVAGLGMVGAGNMKWQSFFDIGQCG